MSDPVQPASGSTARSSTGLSPNVASLLCYVLGFVTGVVFLVIEKENQDVRFHAYQSLGTFLALFVASVVAAAIPLIGWIFSTLLTPLGLVLWILLMVQAAQGQRFKLPWVGDWAEEQVRNA